MRFSRHIEIFRNASKVESKVWECKSWGHDIWMAQEIPRYNIKEMILLSHCESAHELSIIRKMMY